MLFTLSIAKSQTPKFSNKAYIRELGDVVVGRSVGEGGPHPLDGGVVGVLEAPQPLHWLARPRPQVFDPLEHLFPGEVVATHVFALTVEVLGDQNRRPVPSGLQVDHSTGVKTGKVEQI